MTAAAGGRAVRRAAGPERPERPGGSAPAEEAGGRGRRVTGWGIAAMAYGLLGAACVLPVGWLALQLLLHWDASVVGAFEAYRLELLGRTLVYNGLVAAVAIGLAIGPAVVLGRGRGVLVRMLSVALPVALLLPSITYAYGWGQGLRLAGINPFPQSAADVARCIWTLGAWLWPVPAAVVGLALRRLDDQVQQQGLLDGVLWRTTWRQLAGALAASAAIVAVLSVQEFSVWERTGISVVATEVRMVFETGSPSSATNLITQPMTGAALAGVPLSTQAQRSADAIATALPLLLVIGGLSGIAYLLLRRDAAGAEVNQGHWPAALNAGAAAKATTVGVLLLTLGVPIASLLVSLKRSLDPVRMFETFSPQLGGSLVIAALVGALGLGLSAFSAARRWRWALPMSLLTFLVGGQMIAIALIRTCNRPGLEWAYDNPPIVILAHLGRFAWVALAAGAITFSRPWRLLREMAAVDGADAWQTARWVILPLAWPLLLAGGMLVLVLSVGEVPATVLLLPQRPPMLVPLLSTWVHMQRSDDMIEATLLMMASVMALTLLAAGGYWLFARRFRLAPRAGGGATLSRVATRAMVLAAALVLASGCHDRTQPDAIWCETGTGPGQVVYPRGICYDARDDSFFIVDRVAHIQHLDRDGRCIGEWRMAEWAQGKPVGLTVGPDGNVYVADTHYHRIIVFTPEGKEIRRWGSEGTAPGQFIYPTQVRFDDAGHMFVSEYGDHDRIQVFDMNAKYLYEIGSFGDGPGQFSRPDCMVIDGRTIYLTDNGNHRIDVFTTDGKFVRSMGTVGSGPGQFRFPRGLADDGRGHLVVCEFGNNRVQLIDKATGRCLGMWGHGGRQPGELAYPWGVATDRHGRVVAVDAGNNRLQVFRF